MEPRPWEFYPLSCGPSYFVKNPMARFFCADCGSLAQSFISSGKYSGVQFGKIKLKITVGIPVFLGKRATGDYIFILT